MAMSLVFLKLLRESIVFANYDSNQGSSKAIFKGDLKRKFSLMEMKGPVD